MEQDDKFKFTELNQKSSKELFFLFMCAQRSWVTPVGESPTTVITSKPYSQTRCVVVIQGAKRVGYVL